MKMEEKAEKQLFSALDVTFSLLDRVLENTRPRFEMKEMGKIISVGRGISSVQGLPRVKYQELLEFPGNRIGIAFNVDPEEVGAVLLDRTQGLRAGQPVSRTRKVLSVPVGEALLGRIVDPLGRPLDNKGTLYTSETLPLERPAPAIMDRAPVHYPIQTGIQVIDALIPIGRGQRELILGDRQTGKTAIAVDTMINQKDKNVICIYCGIGQENASTAKVVNDLKKYGEMDRYIVVCAGGNETPGMKFIAPYAAMSMGEYFMERGQDVLVVFDDLSKHAKAYRELSLLLRRPPSREAYPGDIFYIHSRLLERSTHLEEDLGGGSLTALPIVETQAQNLSAYIPTNLISITDGQIYLNPRLFQEGVMPAVDIGESVSRVGGKTQFPAYREVASDLKLSYSQFEELENFARFGPRLDEETQQKLKRGHRVREVFKQPQYKPIPVAEQIAVLLSVTEGLLDSVALDKIDKAKKDIRRNMGEKLPEIYEKLQNGNKMEEQDKQAILQMVRETLSLKEQS